MENSKRFLANAQIPQYISFMDGKSHLFQLLDDEESSITDDAGVKKEGIRYRVMEEGTPKSFFTSSIDLISQLAEMPKGAVVKVQLKARKTNDGYRKKYEVEKIEENDVPPDVKDEDIPVYDLASSNNCIE